MFVISLIKKNIKRVLRRLKKTVPVYIPIMNGNLLRDRVALITGGTSGIGLAIAKAFLLNGATVIITSRSKENINKVISELKKENDKIYGLVIDNTDIKSFEIKLKEICAILGKKKIDILVNNAGINKGSTFGNTTSSDFDDVITSNLKGTYFLSQVIAKYMKENKIKGNILNIASSSSIRPAISPYTLSKWGIRALTSGMAKVLIPYGITVNGLAPGPTYTPMLIKDDYEGIELSSNPSYRYTTAEEIANLAVILVSDIGKMIVGDVIYITGGAGIITYDDIKYEF